jgi:hypothetical protein
VTTPRRRWYRVSLRTALLAITLLSVGLGWYRYRAEKWNELARWRATFREHDLLKRSPRYSRYPDGIFHCDNVFGWHIEAHHRHRWLWSAFAVPQVTIVQVHAENPDEIPQGVFAASPHALMLQFTGPGFDDTTLEAMSPALLGLVLSDTRVTDKGVERIAECHKLKNLWLPSTELARPALLHLSDWPDLQSLRLSISLAELVDVKPTCSSSVRYLQLSVEPDEHFSIAELPGDEPLAWLSAFQSVERLNIWGGGPKDDELLRQISRRCTKLRAVELRRGSFSQSGLQALASLRHLQVLTLWDCQLDDNALVALRECPSLTRLDLYPTNGTSRDLVEDLQRRTKIAEIRYTIPGDNTIYTATREP